jgi:tetratricopeptide (TPR) repeat protein
MSLQPIVVKMTASWCMAWHPARDFIGASLALATYLLAAPALAQTSDAWEQCAGKHAATVDKQIEGCTLAIQSSGEAPERLVQALMARAIAFMTKGDYDRAIQDYDQALSLDPKNGLAFNNRGFAYGRIVISTVPLATTRIQSA